MRCSRGRRRHRTLSRREPTLEHQLGVERGRGLRVVPEPEMAQRRDTGHLDASPLACAATPSPAAPVSRSRSAVTRRRVDGAWSRSRSRPSGRPVPSSRNCSRRIAVPPPSLRRCRSRPPWDNPLPSALANTATSGLHAVGQVCPASVQTQPAGHLIEDQHGAGLGRRFAGPLRGSPASGLLPRTGSMTMAARPAPRSATMRRRSSGSL